MPLMSIFMPLANASTALSSWLDSHGTWLNRRWCAASRAARNVMISLRGCSSPSASASMASGISAATPLGPSGSPMSVEVNTSRDSVPSAWPSCEPNAMPPICDIIASSGPAIALASSGSADAHTVEICSATGSHSRFQVSSVLSIQSLGVHATDLVVPAGSAVTPSSQVSARRTASAIAALVCSGTGATNPIELDASWRARS